MEKYEVPSGISTSADHITTPQTQERFHTNLMSSNIPVDDSNTAELGTSVDLERRTFTFEDPTVSHALPADPNVSMSQPKESPQILGSTALKDLRISGTETEIMQTTVSETACGSSPAEAVNVNEGTCSPFSTFLILRLCLALGPSLY